METTKEAKVTTLVRAIDARLPRDEGKERRMLQAALAFTVLSPVAAAGLGSDMPVLGVVIPILVLAADLLVVIYVRRLPRLLISGFVGGGLAGLIALGAGSRLAMRIVSLTGGRREVSIEGTMFLLIAGAMFGAFIGLTLAAALRVWPRSRRSIALVAGSLLAIGLTLDSEAFDELLHEGIGGWLNFPMFLALPFLYGLFAVRTISGVERKLPTGRSRPIDIRTTKAGVS
jgi:hypothetical protein